MRNILILISVLLLGCGSDGEDDETATTASTSSADTSSTTVDANCYYIPDPASGTFVNVGEVGSPEAEEAIQEEQADVLAQETKAGTFIATCYGDIYVTTTSTSYAPPTTQGE